MWKFKISYKGVNHEVEAMNLERAVWKVLETEYIYLLTSDGVNFNDGDYYTLAQLTVPNGNRPGMYALTNLTGISSYIKKLDV